MHARRIAWLALALVVVAHWHVHLGYLRGLNTTRVPEAAPRAPAATLAVPEKEPVRRLVVLVLDGLGFDAAMSAAALRDLARQGAARALRAEFPTFTYPGITTMVTGRPPLYSGVRVNGPRPRLPWDSLPRRAAAAGYAVRVDPEEFANFESLLLLPEDARRLPRKPVPDAPEGRALDLLYDGRVDRIAHAAGTEGEAHRQTLAAVAHLARDVWATLDPAQDVLVVVSEHGHRRRGGHGGAEESASRATLIAAGKGIPERGVLDDGWMRDLAPTLAVLLGTSPPAHSLGTPMVDVLGAPRDEPRPYPGEHAADAAIFRRGALTRLGLAAAGLALALAFALRAGLLAGLTARDALPLALYVPIVLGGHAALGLGVTWSIPMSQLLYQAQTAILGAGAIALTTLLVGRRERAREELLVALVASVPAYALSSAWVGVRLERMAGPFGSFAFLLTVTLFVFPCLWLAVRLLRATAPARGPGARAAVWAASLLGGVALWAAPVLGRFLLPR